MSFVFPAQRYRATVPLRAGGHAVVLHSVQVLMHDRQLAGVGVAPSRTRSHRLGVFVAGSALRRFVQPGLGHERVVTARLAWIGGTLVPLLAGRPGSGVASRSGVGGRRVLVPVGPGLLLPEGAFILAEAARGRRRERRLMAHRLRLLLVDGVPERPG